MRRLVIVLALLVGATALVEGALPCDIVAVSPSCYAALGPGPVEDALSIVEIEGLPTSESEGQLLLTTVSVDADLDLLEWWRTRTDPRFESVDRDVYFPRGVDEEQRRREFDVMMQESQRTAVLAALDELGIEVETNGAEVAELVPDTPADATLEVGEVLVGVDGEQVGTSDDVAAAVRAAGPGARVVLEVLGTDGVIREVTVELAANPDDPSVGFLGVLLSTVVDLPIDVDVDAGQIGGPSAGMMFALAMVDQLSADDLTAGVVVAGTGTITSDGVVGPIGGIRQKVVGATSRGDEAPATVFLVPRANLAEARGGAVSRDVTLVPVDTLSDAVRALADVAAGRTPADAVVLEPA